MPDGKRHCAIVLTTDCDFRLPKQTKASGTDRCHYKQSVRVSNPLGGRRLAAGAPRPVRPRRLCICIFRLPLAAL